MVLENFQKFHDNGTTTVTQSKVARPTVVRKKFAKPPVKVACLACDLEPSSPASVIRRRTYAHTFSQLANSSIETDCELHASSTDPSQALSSERPLINRESFHPHAPVELESILALLVLSVYEYTQRGNLLKMRYRAGQALAIALDMSLHSLGEEYDEFAEGRRRAWWMTGQLSAQHAQIKTHRFRAFSDIPIFIKKHCDLTAANANNLTTCNSTKDSRVQNGISDIRCSCGGLEPFQQSSSEYTPSTASSTSSDYQSISQYSFTSGFPFSIQHSAKVCLRASLLISRMFPSLPIPQPIMDEPKSPQGLTLQPPNQLPRTMPSFACCLMQGSYAMLMIFYKARVEKQLSPDYGNKTTPSDRLIEELRQGLERIIATVTNYAAAFEALDGMREYEDRKLIMNLDEIEGAYQTAFPQP
ncbi:hypothetical protein APSETT444_006247 [Aspergillus pseudonomiae]